MQSYDLAIEATWLLPIAPDNHALGEQTVLIKDGLIAAVQNTQDGPAYQATRTLCLDHHIVMPGLVNAHGHAAMTLLRGAGEDQALQDWLRDTIWPMEAKLVAAPFCALGVELAAAEMIRTGTTTFADMYFFPEVTAQVVKRSGLRAQLGFPVMEFTNAWADGVQDCFHKGLALHDEHRHSAPVERPPL